MKRALLVFGFLFALGCGETALDAGLEAGEESTVSEVDAATAPFGDESDATPNVPDLENPLFCADCGISDDPCSGWSLDSKTCTCTPTSLIGEPCDDGNGCTEEDTCGESGSCVGAINVICDDGEGCTTDACDPATGCVFEEVSDGSACNDGDTCTLVDSCQNGACVGSEVPCPEDDNPCTVPGGCDDITGDCLFLDVPDGTLCEDGNLCTDEDQCVAGLCVSEVETECFDNNPCTDDGCTPKTGCSYYPNQDFCNDGSLCTSNDQCVQGQCNGTVLACDDGIQCTNDGCNPESGCVHEVVDLPCEDGNPCTLGDSCEEAFCVSGTQKVCNDNNTCTSEYCDLDTGDCQFGYNSKVCDDGNECTGEDTCTFGVCEGLNAVNCSDGNPCTLDTCGIGAGCNNVPTDNVACDDNNVCTTGDTCTAGSCAGTESSETECNDGNVCTTDSCDGATGCIHTPANGVPCDDGNTCTTTDVCNQSICVGGSAPNCDDGNVCTADGCDTEGGCTHTDIAASCDDNNACTTIDVCDGGTCTGGVPPQCDDGNMCTTESCDAAEGCLNLANTAGCDDGDACTLGDECQNTVCTSGAAANCDDGIPCTVDACDGIVGCTSTPDDSLCTSGELCITDTCDPNAGCLSENTPNCCGNGLIEGTEECDDGNPVNGDECSEDCLIEATGGGCFQDWLVGTSCNGVNYGNGCSPQDTGYHFIGVIDGYACWWHHKNQAWNTSSASNFWQLGEHFGATPGIGLCGWCFEKSETPVLSSLNSCDGYFDQNNVGAWGWCAESNANSVGFVCVPDVDNGNCP